MKHRILGLALSLLGACAPLTGCTELNHGLRSRSDDQARAPSREEEDEPDKVLDVKSEAKPFFKSTRLPGALSNEGREVERSLGIR
jgi:hypothetical protein